MRCTRAQLSRVSSIRTVSPVEAYLEPAADLQVAVEDGGGDPRAPHSPASPTAPPLRLHDLADATPDPSFLTLGAYALERRNRRCRRPAESHPLARHRKPKPSG